MFLTDILFNAAALNAQYFIDLVLGNLIISFILFSAYFFFFGTSFKKLFYGSVVVTLSILAWVDLGSALGTAIFVGSFLLINYMFKLSSLAIAHDMPSLKPRLVFVNEIMAILAVIIYLVFLAGG